MMLERLWRAFMTVAPRSPRIMVAKGPANTRVMSRMVTPASGPVVGPLRVSLLPKRDFLCCRPRLEVDDKKAKMIAIEK